MSMSMDVACGYGVVFCPPNPNRPWLDVAGMVEPPKSFPWDEAPHDGPVKSWWRTVSIVHCPVRVFVGGSDGRRVTGLFLENTFSKGFVTCRRVLNDSDSHDSVLAEFLAVAGLTVPRSSFDWWCVGDYGS